MSKNSFKEDKEGFNELLESYQAFKMGDSSIYLDEESFESIIEYLF